MKKLSNKCSSCGYTLTFDPESQLLKCCHCDSHETINSKLLSTSNIYNENAQVKTNNNYNRVFECESCGAKTNISENLTGVCPYCGSANLTELSEALKFKPDGIIPFYITKKQAQKKYKEWLKNRHFVPNKLKSYAKLNKMEGYYFPCYCFNFDTHSDYSGVGIKEHRVTRTINGVNGPQQVTDIKVTRHPFSSSRSDKFKNILINSNDLLNGFEVRKLGNFGLENLQVFNTAYLLGFVTKEQTSNVKLCYNEAEIFAKSEIEQNIKFSLGYDRLENFKLKTKFFNQTYNYIYLPVWICNFIYKQKTYKFLVNGYSGHVVGSVPRSPWKILGAVLGVLLVIGGIILLSAYFSK